MRLHLCIAKTSAVVAGRIEKAILMVAAVGDDGEGSAERRMTPLKWSRWTLFGKAKKVRAEREVGKLCVQDVNGTSVSH